MYYFNNMIRNKIAHGRYKGNPDEQIQDEIFAKEDLIKVLENTQIPYSKNPINYFQQWAFNHRKTNQIIKATEFKNKIKSVLSRG